MLSTMLSFAQGVVEFSMLGCVEAASVAFIIYYIYTKTRAPAIIASLFPNLNLNINYRSSLVKFNNMGNELLVTLRSGTNSEVKLQNVLAHGVGTQNMLEVTPHAGRKPYSSRFDWGVYFPYIAQPLRSKKFHYPQVSSFVEKDPMLQRAIKQAADQIWREQKVEGEPHLKPITDDTDFDDGESIKYQNILKSQELRAKRIIRDMRSTLNNFLLTFTSWLVYKLLPCFLSGVVTHTKQIDMLKAAADRAPGIPLIFVPLHRSHLDYIMVTFILTNNDIRSPLVAAGNNLQIPVFGGLLRGLGAFFIKRKIDPVVGKKDILYRAGLHLYLQHALKLGHNVEFFIEGGRTRTGKPCMPKGGILSVIVNAFMEGSIPDALLVPVTVNYERLVDGNFVREQKGEKKVPESFTKAISGIWKALNSNYGLMRIDFNEPYSIRELVQSYNKIAKAEGSTKEVYPKRSTLKHNQSTSSLYGMDVICEEHRILIESISRQVVYDCTAATSVMSTNAIAFLMLTRFRLGATENDFSKALDELRNLLKGQKDMAFSGESTHIFNYACDLLKDLVNRVQHEQGHIIVQPVQTINAMIELSYYSNILTPYFALESILVITFHALLPKPTAVESTSSINVGVSRKKLISTALENCNLFRYEFILNKPTQNLEGMLEKTLDELIIRGLIVLAEVEQMPESAIESRRLARHIDCCLDDSGSDYDFDDDVALRGGGGVDEADIFFASDTVEEQRSLCEVLAPLSQTYLSVAQSLTILYKCSMLENEFIKFVIKDLTNKYQNGICLYAESISTDSVRNCLKLFEKWSVIEICNEHGVRLLSLGNLYESHESNKLLSAIVQKVHAIVPNYKNGYF